MGVKTKLDPTTEKLKPVLVDEKDVDEVTYDLNSYDVEKCIGESSSVGSDNTSTTSSEDENKERGNWTGKLDFLLSCLGYAVGLGNVWRFPYLVYRNGGGAFLIPYIIMLIFAGMPLFFMELSFGQFASLGPISIWRLSPIFKGVGVGMLVVSCLVGIYYNMIIAWSLYYMFASFTAVLPWSTCDNWWNTDACSRKMPEADCLQANGTWENGTCFGENGTSILTNLTSSLNLTLRINGSETKLPSDEYFHNYMLDLSEGFHNMGEVKWQLALCLLLAWIIVFLCLVRGVKSSGKVVYVTATFPYLVLIILLVRGATMPGAIDGILFYVTPQWERLLSAKVWGDAAVQIFFSLSPCWGGLITLASYNKFNNNCYRDAMFVCVGNCLTSIFAGFVIFSIVGFMAYDLGVSVSEVAAQGAGLAFIAYPEAVTKLPISPLWSILFFVMLLTLGLDTQFTVLETVTTTIIDEFPKYLRKRKALVMAVVSIVGYLFGLSFCTRGGFYMLQLMDSYAATYSVLMIGLFELIAIAWVYGADRFMNDIKLMTGNRPSIWWKIMWKFVTPLLMLAIMIFTWVDFKPQSYDDYVYPLWATILGWLTSMSSVVMIPIFAIVAICKAEGTFWNRIKSTAQAGEDWGPALPEHRAQYKAMLLGANTSDSDNIKQSHSSQIPLADFLPKNKNTLNCCDDVISSYSSGIYQKTTESFS
ncbi:sodium- and chloride-dependent glycine transporter 1-like [Lineus longissimus]|uniref:sodium- and chloride-dependent glycine transporter 1-like n=1 Tax=Lineus longissimus TaxID=88925 RepID=UPI002B4D22A8